MTTRSTRRPARRGKEAGPTAELRLDETLDLGAAAKLRDGLLERRGAELRVDASAVNHLGAQCAQVLLAASATWAADGRPLAFTAPSEPFERGARLLGLQHILSAKGSPE